MTPQTPERTPPKEVTPVSRPEPPITWVWPPQNFDDLKYLCLPDDADEDSFD